MGTLLLRATLPAILAGAFGMQLAHADIYTWVDASGSINVSNLAPPDGVRVSSVIRASAPEAAARADAAREAARQAEVQALAERVRELEDNVELAKRQAPPPADYRAIPPPPVIQYFVAPPAQYALNPALPANNGWNNGWNNGCDPAWSDCGFWGFPGIYPTSVVVLRAPNFRHFHPGRGGHRSPVPPQVRAPGTFRRG